MVISTMTSLSHTLNYTLHTASPFQLADLSARVMHLLWVSSSRSPPSSMFRSFCSGIIQATQISASVIVLALYYVRRFKFHHPRTYAGVGSEYRMFTVALMLASKFLEDNTFTTKTWSEVSDIPACELAIMQREFLLAIDHRLNVSDQDYDLWISQLDALVFSSRPAKQTLHSNAILVTSAKPCSFLSPPLPSLHTPELCALTMSSNCPSPSTPNSSLDECLHTSNIPSSSLASSFSSMAGQKRSWCDPAVVATSVGFPSAAQQQQHQQCYNPPAVFGQTLTKRPRLSALPPLSLPSSALSVGNILDIRPTPASTNNTTTMADAAAVAAVAAAIATSAPYTSAQFTFRSQLPPQSASTSIATSLPSFPTLIRSTFGQNVPSNALPVFSNPAITQHPYPLVVGSSLCF